MARGAVACVNGTPALHLSLLLAGMQPGEEVIIPNLTFIAPISTVRYANAEPGFMDCDDYLNLGVAKLEQFLEQEYAPADHGGSAQLSRYMPLVRFAAESKNAASVRPAIRLNLAALTAGKSSAGFTLQMPMEKLPCEHSTGATGSGVRQPATAAITMAAEVSRLGTHLLYPIFKLPPPYQPPLPRSQTTQTGLSAIVSQSCLDCLSARSSAATDTCEIWHW